MVHSAAAESRFMGRQRIRKEDDARYNP